MALPQKLRLAAGPGRPRRGRPAHPRLPAANQRQKSNASTEPREHFLATEKGPIIAHHTLGYQLTSAGIDRAGTEGAWLLPEDPDASARSLRDALSTYSGATVAVVIADSDGRADRRGATVISIGAAGVAPLRVTEHGGKRQEERPSPTSSLRQRGSSSASAVVAPRSRSCAVSRTAPVTRAWPRCSITGREARHHAARQSRRTPALCERRRSCMVLG
ncbi:coenzyme F420-0:L-glutamate ligase [Streptomyces sp. NPDC046727]|uniref:coenzyme F420-0:L-glutamate ligase n=1 Tax=Streptomyces sp. NPDC046727 TaxID=3155373 RepID=UPI0033C1D398